VIYADWSNFFADISAVLTAVSVPDFQFFSVKVHSLFFVLVVTEALFVCSVSLTSCCVSVV